MVHTWVRGWDLRAEPPREKLYSVSPLPGLNHLADEVADLLRIIPL